ncbi:MAG: hypothetical protein QOJ66_379 [Ilumatobacteraceae bacterium]
MSQYFDDDPIEVYLDRLLVALPGSPRHVRQTLAEVEAHLRDSAERARHDGLDDHAAAVAAVKRMGPIEGVVEGRGHRLGLTPARRRRVVLGGLFVGAIGGIAIAVAGVLAGIVRMIAGDRAIGVPFPTGSYSAADCSRWMIAYPHAPDCVSAMTIDHANDFVRNAAVAGGCGLIALATFARLRRRWTSRAVATALPTWSEDVLGCVLSSVATVVLLGQGVDSLMVTRGQGAGQSLCLAVGAAAATFVFGVRAKSTLAKPLRTS